MQFIYREEDDKGWHPKLPLLKRLPPPRGDVASSGWGEEQLLPSSPCGEYEISDSCLGVPDCYSGLVQALDKDEDDDVTPNDVFLHVHTKDHDGATFIDSRSAWFHAELVRRREEHTHATPDQPIDEKQLYYDATGECSKGRVYGLGSLAKRKRRYEDLGASMSREPMMRHSELDAVVQRLA
ncbi:hypothetical protein Scep_027766 [Stephania cephalantha]|uniref:Uncharacterized protein n=1 Tax=Stephania cephalantha TaxID=152367 RepID=A0AAP0E8M9_9MAGN